MRTFLAGLLIVTPLVAFAADPPQETEKVYIYNPMFTATKYQETSRDGRVGYVMGLWDGLRAAQAVTSGQCEYNYWYKDYQENKMTNFQLEAIFSKFLSDHPEKWHEPLNGLFVDAMYDAWLKMQSQNQ